MNSKFLPLSQAFGSPPGSGWQWSSTLLLLRVMIFKLHILQMQKCTFLEEACRPIVCNNLHIYHEHSPSVSAPPFPYVIWFKCSLSENLNITAFLPISLCHSLSLDRDTEMRKRNFMSIFPSIFISITHTLASGRRLAQGWYLPNYSWIPKLRFKIMKTP